MPSFSKLTLLALADSSLAIANATNDAEHTVAAELAGAVPADALHADVNSQDAPKVELVQLNDVKAVVNDNAEEKRDEATDFKLMQDTKNLIGTIINMCSKSSKNIEKRDTLMTEKLNELVNMMSLDSDFVDKFTSKSVHKLLERCELPAQSAKWNTELKKVRKAVQESLVRQKNAANAAKQVELEKPSDHVLIPNQAGVMTANDNSASVTSTFMSLIGIFVAAVMII